jgi:hypothetical protein
LEYVAKGFSMINFSKVGIARGVVGTIKKMATVD